MRQRRKFNLSLFLAAVILSLLHSNVLTAQVTIGSVEKPAAGALLDIKEDGETTKGLGLPRVVLKSLSELTMGNFVIPDEDDEYKKHIGLLVYNITKNEVSTETRLCPGLHVWNGEKWQPIVPYPVWEYKKTPIGYSTQDFYHLDRNIPALWPDDKNPDDYELGSVGTFFDSRPNGEYTEYEATRFYVGVYSKREYFKELTSYSCDPNDPQYIEREIAGPITRVFDDGVWMSQNLATAVTPDGTAIAKHTTTGSDTEPQYALPNLSTGTMTLQGGLYNFAAATNNERPEISDQGGGNREGFPIQGICPDGWILPSDREWTDLENGMILYTAKFSSTPNIGGALVSYNNEDIFRGKHATPMKSVTPIASVQTRGSSKASAQGGFNALLVGLVDGGVAKDYGRFTNMWSASTSNRSTSYGRSLFASPDNGSDPANVLRFYFPRKQLFSVRCKRAL